MTDQAAIRSKIIELTDARGPEKTICPSEIARALAPKAWRDLMPEVREPATRLADAGKIDVTQKGEVVDPRAAKGPIRLRTGRS